MKQSCNIFEPISKKTVLAMLRAPSVLGINQGEYVEYTNDKGITYQLRVIKVARDTVTLDTKNGAIVVPKSQVKSNEKPVVYDNIPEEDWTITSFDSRTKVVCIDIKTKQGIRHTSVVLPAIIISP